MSIKNQIGNRYGKLTVIQRDQDFSNQRKRKNAFWICQCDCGNTKSILGTKLRNGETKSCGCLRKETKDNIIDMTGQKFGHLVVIRRARSTLGGIATWFCKCDCGNPNEIEITGSHLRTGHTTSCGRCLKSSKGQQIIEKILQQNSIQYETEKTFNDCRFPQTNVLARFDFYINQKYLIEFDGKQHFNYTENKGWNNKENFIKTKERDQYKNNWCKEKNIKLIRIPYWHLEKITINDLLLESSQYIIN